MATLFCLKDAFDLNPVLMRLFTQLLGIAEARRLAYPLVFILKAADGGEQMVQFVAPGEAPACVSSLHPASPDLRSPIAVSMHGWDAARVVYATLQFRVRDDAIQIEANPAWEITSESEA